MNDEASSGIQIIRTTEAFCLIFLFMMPGVVPLMIKQSFGYWGVVLWLISCVSWSSLRHWQEFKICERQYIDHRRSNSKSAPPVYSRSLVDTYASFCLVSVAWGIYLATILLHFR
jgi:hypothetical protein